MSSVSLIVGSVGTGKSVLALQLAESEDLVRVSPDDYGFRPDKNRLIRESVHAELERNPAKSLVIDNGGGLFTYSRVLNVDDLANLADRLKLYVPQELLNFVRGFKIDKLKWKRMSFYDFMDLEYVKNCVIMANGDDPCGRTFQLIKDKFLMRTEQAVRYRFSVGKYVISREGKFGHFLTEEDAMTTMKSVTNKNFNSQIILALWFIYTRRPIYGFTYDDKTHKVSL